MAPGWSSSPRDTTTSVPATAKGYLFILNADSGALLRRSAPTSATPHPERSGADHRLGNFPDNNNTTQRVYGGDLLGNLWRFDINGDIPSPSTRRSTTRSGWRP
jgi:hypothetical protein